MNILCKPLAQAGRVCIAIKPLELTCFMPGYRVNLTTAVEMECLSYLNRSVTSTSAVDYMSKQGVETTVLLLHQRSWQCTVGISVKLGRDDVHAEF